MKLNYVDNLSLGKKRVFIRVDFNVPMDDQGNISDPTRINAALPTIKYVLEQGGKVILASHLGRPKGTPNSKFTLERVGEYLANTLKLEVTFFSDYLSDGFSKAIEELSNNRIMLLENLRFHPGETKNDLDFTQKLSEHIDMYVNDAFGTCHRAHASTTGLPDLLPIDRKGAGFLIKKEIEYLSTAIENPKRPYTAILGGAKVSDKIDVILNLLNSVNKLIIGGAMAYTFLRFQNCKTSNSLVEEDKLSLIKTILDKAEDRKVQVFIPMDHIVSNEIKPTAQTNYIDTNDITLDGVMGLDIGKKTIQTYIEEINSSSTIFWNGPMGVFEMEPFADGTRSIAKALAEHPGITIIGGGDSAFAIRKFGFENQVSHISTGGGASLELLEGKELPGLKTLKLY